MREFRRAGNPLLLLSLTVALTSCTNQLDRDIKIVLPNDYVGEFTIVKDQSGAPFRAEAAYYVFVIPSTGQMRTPNVVPFSKWHQLRVEYEDGRVLVDASSDASSSDGLTVKNRGATGGTRRTGRSSSETSSRYDGATYRWEVLASD